MGKSISARMLRDTVSQLRHGGLIIYPTETAYALGCDARNMAAVRAIYRLKGRSARKPLALIAADPKMVERFFRLPPTAHRLASAHWPGPLTLILPIRDARIRHALGIREAGIRVSSHPVARALSARLGAPIVSTSANRSGRGTCYSLRSALRSLGRPFSLLPTPYSLVPIDGGTLPRRKPSTVVSFKRGIAVVLRAGPVRIPTHHAPRTSH